MNYVIVTIVPLSGPVRTYTANATTYAPKQNAITWQFMDTDGAEHTVLMTSVQEIIISAVMTEEV